MKKQHYYLGRHSAFEVSEDPWFSRALEVRSCTERMAERIREAGGLSFDNWNEANEREEIENYPPGVTGIIPKCVGSWKQIGGTVFFVPANN